MSRCYIIGKGKLPDAVHASHKSYVKRAKIGIVIQRFATLTPSMVDELRVGDIASIIVSPDQSSTLLVHAETCEDSVRATGQADMLIMVEGSIHAVNTLPYTIQVAMALDGPSTSGANVLVLGSQTLCASVLYCALTLMLSSTIYLVRIPIILWWPCVHIQQLDNTPERFDQLIARLAKVVAPHLLAKVVDVIEKPGTDISIVISTLEDGFTQRTPALYTVVKSVLNAKPPGHYLDVGDQSDDDGVWVREANDADWKVSYLGKIVDLSCPSLYQKMGHKGDGARYCQLKGGWDKDTFLDSN
ncbi:hypothetical protein D9758_018359 [Tetrapyrgos nigripes]|uniref:Uncharacterized protein n=1 Tax=Tetrapyrgos nigripes TaxID=182062 RepID=A0A8H5C3Z8_9AGAR|nr:hypothetical protein D9758_018359 [Tetrapyrgos nigripes]